jgi:hypothetical protein
MFNTTATQDVANCIAVADIKLDGVVVAKKVPVTHILFLEKQLVDLNTFIGALPTLDPAEEWIYSLEAGCFKSSAKDTIKSNKVKKNHIKYEATKEHPAQVETYETEVPVGTWTTIKFSGNISSDRKNQLLTKVRELAKALKLAREEANGIEVEKSTIGSDILNYIFG